MATPKSDVCQSVGRILRSKHQSPLVIDILDTHDVFLSQFNKRKAYYLKKNIRSKFMKISAIYNMTSFAILKLKKKKTQTKLSH